ncbi:MAG: phytoene desaturase [Flavobacteriales bacterium]|nr:phytoene desaturase [Flavobacteriales bacterium]MBL0043866.1 phytoene desaturase [Flavobacteriales bacterium]
MPSAIVMGSGFAGIAAATTLASKGYSVTIVEKNDDVGGRARVWQKDGYTFDMGPSWYWMPDVFERYFERFGHKVDSQYDLVRLDPSYQVIFGPENQWDVPAGIPALKDFFEGIEVGAGAQLEKFMAEAKVKYDLGMNELVYTPSLSWSEFIRPKVIAGLLRTSAIGSMRGHVAKHFQDRRIRQLLEFPVLFLGSTPQHTPALYSLMNYADMALGTWYPMGGMGKIIDAMIRVAKEQGVTLRTGAPVEQILVEQGRAVGVRTRDGELHADVVVASADYHHVEQELLGSEHRSYSERYWSDRVMAPSSLLFYMGFNKRLPKLLHHNLFFESSFDQHAREIYDEPQWPSRPLMYICAPSITDASVAPEGHENLFALIPIATGLTDTEDVRDHYSRQVIERISGQCGFDVEPHMVLHRSYCINDFKSDYNAFGGNAYGLASTLKQTAVGKPSMKSKRVKGLYYAGQLTVPGPGVPPSLISGQVVADLIAKEHQTA